MKKSSHQRRQHERGLGSAKVPWLVMLALLTAPAPGWTNDWASNRDPKVNNHPNHSGAGSRPVCR